jgi:DNA-binding Xre family transcriptional regulator
MKTVPENTIDSQNATPNTGLMLTSYFKEKRIRKNALARMLNRNPSTLVSFTKNKTIQTTVLWEICHALKHNFFADIAALFPENFTNNVKPNTDAAERIAALELENVILKAEVAILLKAMKG